MTNTDARPVRILLALLTRAWRRHVRLMATRKAYAAAVTISAALVAGEVGPTDAKRWLAELLARAAAGWAARQSAT